MPQLPSVLERICKKNRWTASGDSLEYTLPNGRKQLIFAEEFAHGDERMLRLYSHVGEESELTEIRLRAALSLNYKLPHGAFALREGKLVLTETFLLREADEDEVASAIRYLAESADRYERFIYGTDRY